MGINIVSQEYSGDADPSQGQKQDYLHLWEQCGIDDPEDSTERWNPEAPVVIARGRLADARKVFDSRGWEVLPQGKRGQKILRWGANHAFLARPANPERSVHNWCSKWAPWLFIDTPRARAELAELLACVKTSNKRYSADQCAAVLEITVSDRQGLCKPRRLSHRRMVRRPGRQGCRRN